MPGKRDFTLKALTVPCPLFYLLSTSSGVLSWKQPAERLSYCEACLLFLSTELPLHSRVSPVNPDPALRSRSTPELLGNKSCSVPTRSQPADRMRSRFGQRERFLLALFALRFPHPQRVPLGASVNIYTAISILGPGLFSADM